MFNSEQGKNLYMLEDFTNKLVKLKLSKNGEKEETEKENYLLDNRVQDFLLIDDAQIIQKIVMMSLQANNGQVSKVYTPLKIVDEYQASHDNIKALPEEDKIEERSEPRVNQFKINMYSSQGVYNRYECTLNKISWKTVQEKTKVQEYLQKTGINFENSLQERETSFETLLFFKFFQQVDDFQRIDIFRSLKVNILKVKISNADLEIDSITGKTVINFEIVVDYKQNIEDSPVILGSLTFEKTHRQIKALIRDHGLPYTKIKMLSRDSQIYETQSSLEKLVKVPHLLEKISAMNFVTTDYIFKAGLAPKQATKNQFIDLELRERKVSMDGFEDEASSYKFEENNPLQGYMKSPLVDEKNLMINLSPQNMNEEEMDFDDDQMKKP